MDLDKLLMTGRTIRVVGFDDAHYADKSIGAPVNVAGIICGGTRFEGMLWSSLEKDGMDATDVIARSLSDSKFKAQVHVVLLDGITFGGCNVVDLPDLAERLGLPVVAVMRRRPDIEAFKHVVTKLPNCEERQRCVAAAGVIHEIDGWTFQVVGEEPAVIARVLTRLTDQGKVPEALRIAHLIGSAIKLRQSSNRA